MSLMKSYFVLQIARAIAFIISELLRENQQVGGIKFVMYQYSIVLIDLIANKLLVHKFKILDKWISCPFEYWQIKKSLTCSNYLITNLDKFWFVFFQKKCNEVIKTD